jgi:predicted GNAT family N-acyltransferase
MATESLREYLVQPMDVSIHRREDFICESPELMDFIQKRARKEMEARVSACFVMTPADEPGVIAGYYTLSAATINTQSLPTEFVRRLPRYPEFPATLLGRLARDLKFRGMGIGDRLVMSALCQAYKSSREIGSIAVVTDPKDEQAKNFYLEFGFRPLTGNRLFLFIQQIPNLL